MEINEYLNLRDNLLYDFSNDGSSKEYSDIDNIYEKFFVYMAVKADNIKEDGILKNAKEFSECCKKIYKVKDPDSNSVLLQEIYKKLYGSEDYLKYCINYSKYCITGDTMNSVNTTLNMTSFDKIGEVIEKKEEREKRTTNFSKKYRLGMYACYKEQNKKEQNKLNEFLSRFDNIKGLKEFISLYHTIGNFIPFPCDCNTKRGRGKTQDYWDLTLLCIYIYYEEKKEDYIETIVGNEKKNYFIEWLNGFGSWDNFVEKNYLQDFVNENPKYVSHDECQKYGLPKELWKDHFDNFDGKFDGKKVALPTNKEQIEQFCNNASAWILARGQRMINELRIKMHETAKTF